MQIFINKNLLAVDIDISHKVKSSTFPFMVEFKQKNVGSESEKSQIFDFLPDYSRQHRENPNHPAAILSG